MANAVTVIRLPNVLAKTGLKRASLYKKIASKEFPPAIRLGERSVGWLLDEVDAWIQDRITESRGIRRADRRQSKQKSL